MNQGKAAWYILKRSLKVNSKQNANISVSSGTVGVSKCVDPFIATITACNDLMAKGVKPEGVNATIMLPLNGREQRIKEIKADIDSACAFYDIELTGGHTAVVDVVTQPVCTVTAFGKASTERKPALQAKDIVLVNYAALGGTYVLACDYEEKLKKRFSSRIMDAVFALREHLAIKDIVNDLNIAGISYMSDVSEGGIFQSLWELSEVLECGFEVKLGQIPLLQETIEICDYFDVNPYELLGTGAVLLVCDEGERIRDAISDKGIPVSIIGSITSDNDKIIIAHDEKRYLESKREDSLYQARKKEDSNEREDS